MRGVAQPIYVAFVDVLAMDSAEDPKKLPYKAARRHGIREATAGARVGWAQLESAKWLRRGRERGALL